MKVFPQSVPLDVMKKAVISKTFLITSAYASSQEQGAERAESSIEHYCDTQ